ncbi:Hypothetical predicted protein [Cloeon dipterum]|nr:Hypothetical predicted protein [Cloeon dipterum]
MSEPYGAWPNSGRNVYTRCNGFNCGYPLQQDCTRILNPWFNWCHGQHPPQFPPCPLVAGAGKPHLSPGSPPLASKVTPMEEQPPDTDRFTWLLGTPSPIKAQEHSITQPQSQTKPPLPDVTQRNPTNTDGHKIVAVPNSQYLPNVQSQWSSHPWFYPGANTGRLPMDWANSQVNGWDYLPLYAPSGVAGSGGYFPAAAR